MRNVPQNELLSAYLDGELTAVEHAEVEQLLATNPAARQLVDELRALRAKLQALPTHQVGHDISAEVLRRAQQQGLATDPPKPGENLPKPGEKESPPPESPVSGSLRRVLRPRTLVWSGVAASVALLLVALEWGNLWESRPTPIAQKGPASGAELDSAARGTKTAEAAGEELGREGAPIELADADDDRRRGRDVFGDMEVPQPLRETEATSDAPAPGERRSIKLADALPSAETPATTPVPKKGDQAGPADYAGMGGRGGAGRGGFGQQIAPTADETPLPGRDLALKARAPAAPAASPSVEALTGLPGRAAQPAEVLVTLRCHAKAEAVPLFEDLLKRQQITPAGTRAESAVQAGPVNGQMARGAYGKLSSALAKDATEIQYDFEATPDQLGTLLAFIHRRPKDFSFPTSPSGMGVVSEDVLNLLGTHRVLDQRPAKGLQEYGARFRRGRIDDLASKKHGLRERVGPDRGQPFEADEELLLDAKDPKPREVAAGQGRDFRFEKEHAAEAEAEGEKAVPEDPARASGFLGRPKRPSPKREPKSESGEKAKQSIPSLPTQSPQKGVVKYRVRLVLEIRRPPGDMGASVAKESAEDHAEAKAAGKPAEAAKKLPAGAVKAAELER